MTTCIECHGDVGDSTAERVYVKPGEKVGTSLGPICGDCAAPDKPFPRYVNYEAKIEISHDRTSAKAIIQLVTLDGKYGLEIPMDCTNELRSIVERLNTAALLRGEEVLS